jgi:hypothetical protein
MLTDPTVHAGVAAAKNCGEISVRTMFASAGRNGERTSAGPEAHAGEISRIR